MTSFTSSAATIASTAVAVHPPENVREFLMAAIRCARLRVQLLQTEIDEVGLALKFNMVSSEVAVGWLEDIGAMGFINTALIASSAAAASS